MLRGKCTWTAAKRHPGLLLTPTIILVCVPGVTIAQLINSVPTLPPPNKKEITQTVEKNGRHQPQRCFFTETVRDTTARSGGDSEMCPERTLRTGHNRVSKMDQPILPSPRGVPTCIQRQPSPWKKHEQKCPALSPMKPAVRPSPGF